MGAGEGMRRPHLTGCHSSATISLLLNPHFCAKFLADFTVLSSPSLHVRGFFTRNTAIVGIPSTSDESPKPSRQKLQIRGGIIGC